MKKKYVNKQDIINILARTQLFRAIPEKDIEKVMQDNFGTVKQYRKGSRILSSGDTFDYVGVVLEGSIIIHHLSKDGSISTVHVLKERKTLGLEYVESRQPKSRFDYTALTDVYLFCIEKGFLKSGDAYISQQLLLNAMNLLAHENLRQNQKLHILSMGTIRKKLITFLYYEYEKCNSRQFDISFNRESLAAYLSVNRSSLSRELSQMEAEGIIRTRGRHFEILSDSIINQEDADC